VLDAVVGGEVAVGEGDHRRHHAERLHHALAQGGGLEAAAQDRRRDQGRADRQRHPRVLERKASGGQAAADHRNDRERLGEFERPAQAGQARGELRGELRFALRGDLDLAVPAAHGGRPVGRPVNQEAVAKRHSPESELVIGHRSKIDGRLARPPRSTAALLARSSSPP
jgi:hypothetical protein